MERLVSLGVLLVAAAIGIYAISSLNGFVEGTPRVKEGYNSASKGPSHANAEANANANANAKAKEDVNKPFDELLSSIKARTPNLGTVPTQQNLDMISNNGPDPKDTAASYQPHQEVIYPHEFPRARVQALKATTEKGTVAEKIEEESYLTPSVRENIRNDGVKGGAYDPQDNAMKNSYEIVYQHE